MGVLVWKSHWQVKDLQVGNTSLSSFEFCDYDCDVCVCVCVCTRVCAGSRPEREGLQGWMQENH